MARNSNKLFKILDVGGQTQFTKTYWTDDVKGAVRGLDGDAQFIAAGINANWRIMEFGFVYARQRNRDLVRITDPLRGEPISVAFDGEGQELFAKAQLGKFAILGGFDNYVPSSRDPAISSDSHIKFGIAGVEWHFSPGGYAYAELKLDSSRNSIRSDDFNVFSLGFRYDFSMRLGHF